MIDKMLDITHGLFDSHCHFDFEVFDHSRGSLWRECQSQGVEGLMIPGVEPKQWGRANQYADSYPNIVTSAGIHPWWVDTLSYFPEKNEWLEALNHPACVAIGECGLDGAIDTPLDQQTLIFEKQLELAVEMDKPLIIHVRQTHNETLRLIKRYLPNRGGVIHGFSGSKELALSYWKMGFYLGIGGTITYPRANKTRQMVKAMPLESLVLETDAPDMPLYGYQGQTNSPLSVIQVAQALADLRQEPLDTIAQITTTNSARLFGLSKR